MLYDKGLRFLEGVSRKHKHAITAFAVAGVVGASCFSVATPAKATEDVKTDSVYNLHQKPLYEGEYAFDVIKSKITWADFSEYGENLKVVKNQKGKDKKVLQIGSTLTLEPIPGYKLKAEVVDLKPYLASDYYKSRIDADPQASDADKASYKPEQNNFCHEIIGGKDTGKMLPTSMALDKQGRYSHLGKNGVKGPGDCTLGSLNDGDNVGVTFKFTATYQGHDVDPKVIVTDGEECTDNGREWTAFITNGSPWEFIANIGDPKSSDPIIISEKNYSKNGPIDIRPFAKYYIAPNENGGLGTQFFGGFSNMISHNHATPLVVTRYADQVSLYVNSRGMQASMFGFIFDEEGDAPESYGTAAHFIKNGNPYLGTVEPDYDFGLPGDDWVRDDIYGGDEGEEQLVGKGKKYELMVGEDKTYSMDILASKGTAANPCADGPWVKAWVDFNNNGKFDEFEASEPVEVTDQNQKVTLKFANPEIKQITDVNIDKIGMRVRIAFDKNEIANPTGYASTGEVEDFQIRVTHAPRGEYKTTTGMQGLPQTAVFKGKDGFLAYGSEDNDLDKPNTILANAEHPIKIVTPEGKLLSEYKVDGEGTYSVSDTGEVSFTPEPGFTGTTTGVCLRAVDDNLRSTGWTADEESLNNNQGAKAGYLIDGKKTMDAVYQPVVTPVVPTADPAHSIDIQGAVQTGTPTFKAGNENVPLVVSSDNPAYFVDADGNKIDETTIDAMKDGKKIGVYEIDPETAKVTFTPDKDFVGTPDPCGVGAKDSNGTQATTTYSPEVTPVVPSATPAETTDIQGKTQHGTVKFESGNENVPIELSSDNPAYFVDKDGNKIEGTTIDATDNGVKVGTFTLNPETGEVTFTPNKDYVGTPDPAKVAAKDANGTQASTTYTPTVTPVVPTADPATSKGPQGLAQTGVPQFKAGNENVPLVLSSDNPAYFVDADGNKIDGNTVDATKDGKTVGTYTIDGATGVVTFQPNPDFVGVADPAYVGAKDANGTQATTTYTPEVIAVDPKATPAESTDIQGATQTGTPKFEGGDEKVPVKLSVDNPAYFVDKDGNKIEGTTIDAKKDGAKVGVYEIDPITAKVTFTPNPDFVGTPDPAKVAAKDANGTEVVTYYSPHVTPVTPTATPAISEGLQGQPQTGAPSFKGGNPLVPVEISAENPVYFVDGDGNKIDGNTVDATKDGKTVGTYTIDGATGVVTFQPNPDFIGTPEPAKVGAKDTNGTQVITTYTPSVTPVIPTSTPGTSEAPQGEPQTGTCQFIPGNPLVPVVVGPDNPAYFVDGNGNKIDETTVDATKDGKKVGTYTIDPNTGIVTFVPNPDFVGTPDPALIGTKDANGTEVVGTYTPTSTPFTPIKPEKPGKSGPETSDPTKSGIMTVMAMASGLVMGLAGKLRKKNNR